MSSKTPGACEPFGPENRHPSLARSRPATAHHADVGGPAPASHASPNRRLVRLRVP